MATYQTILPPPQSVDSLDAWGGLDALPWSLDSGVWLRAGVYGMLASESSSSKESLKKWVRVRTSDILQGVASGGEAEGNIIRDLVISDSARMEGEQIGGVARAIPISPIHGKSGDIVEPYRVREGVERSSTLSGNALKVYRVRTESYDSFSQSSAGIILLRLLALFADGEANSIESLSPQYKGWEWGNIQPHGADWTILNSGQCDWNKMPGGNSDWRGVVEWQ